MVAVPLPPWLFGNGITFGAGDPMTRRPGDDLFEDTRMSFGEHLEELRKTLVRCLIFIGLGCVVGFLVAESVVNFLQGPLVRAIKEYNDNAAMQRYTDRIGFYPPEIETRVDEGLAPQTVYLDPGQLIEAIRSISPGSFAGIDLTPYRFPKTAIPPEQTRAIASAILNPPQEDAPRARRLTALRELIPATDQRSLAELGNQETDRDRLVAVLNRLIEMPELHNDPAFSTELAESSWSYAELFMPARENQLALMKQQIEKQPDNTELSRRLNRLLVAAVFPGQVRPPTIDLVPVEIWQNISEGTQALSPHEVFMVWIKAAILTGLVLSAPFVFHQLWLFVAAGLYPHEQKYVYYYLPISILLFVFGVCLAFFFVFDPVLQFLFSFNASMGISPQLRIGEWLSFVMFLPLGFGIAFQLPLVMLFTNRMGLVSMDVYKKNWRLAVMIISVLSMLLTPADPISMILLGAPLTLLYFFGIALCKWMPRPQNPFGDEALRPAP
jgi:sec-independent protein translocase protein TatC